MRRSSNNIRILFKWVASHSYANEEVIRYLIRHGKDVSNLGGFCDEERTVNRVHHSSDRM